MASAELYLLVRVDEATARLHAIAQLSTPAAVSELAGLPPAAALARLDQVHELARQALAHARIIDGERVRHGTDGHQGRDGHEADPGGRARQPEADLHRGRPDVQLDRVPDVPGRTDREGGRPDQRPQPVHDEVEGAGIDGTYHREAPSPRDPFGGPPPEFQWLD